MHIKSKVFIQTLQISQDMHRISFDFEVNNKNTKKVFGANLPPFNTINLDLPPIQLGLRERKTEMKNLKKIKLQLTIQTVLCSHNSIVLKDAADFIE